MNDDSTRSTLPSASGLSSANPSSSVTAAPAFAALRRAQEIASGSGSIPVITAAGSACAASITRLPVPQPISRTRVPGSIPAWTSSRQCASRAPRNRENRS